jgi:hypothetical protein
VVKRAVTFVSATSDSMAGNGLLDLWWVVVGSAVKLLGKVATPNFFPTRLARFHKVRPVGVQTAPPSRDKFYSRVGTSVHPNVFVTSCSSSERSVRAWYTSQGYYIQKVQDFDTITFTMVEYVEQAG